MLERQTDQPLYESALWNRPVSQIGAGRLLLIGGHSGSFNFVQSLYQSALAAGIGHCEVALPESLRRLVGPEAAHYLPVTNSGSLGPSAAGQIEQLAEDFDAVGLGGDLSLNSQTAVLIETLMTKLEPSPLIYADALDQASKLFPQLIEHTGELIALNTRQALKLAGALKIPLATHDNLTSKVEMVQKVSAATQKHIALVEHEIIVAGGERTSLTPLAVPLDLPLAYGLLITFWLQQATKQFEALTTAAFIAREVSKLAPTNHQAGWNSIQEVLAKY